MEKQFARLTIQPITNLDVHQTFLKVFSFLGSFLICNLQGSNLQSCQANNFINIRLLSMKLPCPYPICHYYKTNRIPQSIEVVMCFMPKKSWASNI